MANVTLNLMTRYALRDNCEALERIWSVQHWSRSLDRVKVIITERATPTLQVFRLTFAGASQSYDDVVVERRRNGLRIEVVHLVPPPDVLDLKGVWWLAQPDGKYLYAHRTLTLEEYQCTAAKVRSTFQILKENIQKLMDGSRPTTQ